MNMVELNISNRIKNKFGKLSDYHYTLFVSILVSVCAVITITSVVFQNRFNQELTNSYNENVEKNVKQFEILAGEMIDRFKNMAITIAIDSELKSLVYSSPNVENSLSIMKKLNVYKKYNGNVYSIYYYNKQRNEIYTDSTSKVDTKGTFYDYEAVGMIDEASKSNDKFRHFTREYIGSDEDITLQRMKNRGIQSFVLSDTDDNCIVINVSFEELSSIMNKPKIAEKSSMYLLDKNFRSLLSTNEYLDFNKYSKYFDNKSGMFSVTEGGSDLYIHYSKVNEYDWACVSVTPIKMITEQFSLNRIKTTIATILLMLLAVMLSYALSYWLYKPYNNLVNKIYALTKDIKDEKKVKKDYYLKSAINKHNIKDAKELLQELYNKSIINLDINKPMALMIIKLKNIKAFYENFNLSERNSMLYGITNIAIEIGGEMGIELDGVQNGEELILLINYADVKEYENIEEFVEVCKKLVYTHLNLEFYAIMGKIDLEQFGFESWYENVKKAYEYVFVLGNPLVIDSGLISQGEPLAYPAEIEGRILKIMAVGVDSKEELRECLKEFATVVSKTNPKDAKLYCLQLTIALGGLIDSHIALSYVVELESIYEIVEFLEVECSKIISHKMVNNNAQHKDIIAIINTLIDEGYSDVNFSTDVIADKISLSKVYVSRIYKNTTGKSLATSIMDYRIKRAKELIIETNLPLNTISKQTGFSYYTYFTATFKKYEHISPNDYRSINKK